MAVQQTSSSSGPTTGAPSAPSEVTSAPSEAPSASSKQPKKQSSGGKRRRFFSAYAKTWVGMSPMFLMAEAILPGQKVGGTFKKGIGELSVSANELVDILGVHGKDVVVVLDEHFKLSDRLGTSNKPGTQGSVTKATEKWDEQSKRAAEIIRAAGQNAIVAVSTSLDKAQSQIHDSSPALKKAVSKHGRDIIILVDRSLKNPIVVTGVSRFARSKGIPYSEGLLQLASMGLNRILTHLPEDVGGEVEGEVLSEVAKARKREGGTGQVTEVDAAELERSRSEAERAEAREAAQLGKDADGNDPKVEEKDGNEPSVGEKDGKCVVA